MKGGKSVYMWLSLLLLGVLQGGMLQGVQGEESIGDSLRREQLMGVNGNLQADEGGADDSDQPVEAPLPAEKELIGKAAEAVKAARKHPHRNGPHKGPHNGPHNVPHNVPHNGPHKNPFERWVPDAMMMNGPAHDEEITHLKELVKKLREELQRVRQENVRMLMQLNHEVIAPRRERHKARMQKMQSEQEHRRKK